MCAPVTNVIFFISMLVAAGALRASSDCSLINHNSSVWKKINQNCEDSRKLEYCREIGELELDNIKNETIPTSFTACSENQAEYFVYYDVSNNSCIIDHARDNLRLSPNENGSIYLFQNCTDDHGQTNREENTNSTRIVVSVVCMIIMVLLLSVYFGLMIHYRCFSCRN